MLPVLLLLMINYGSDKSIFVLCIGKSYLLIFVHILIEIIWASFTIQAKKNHPLALCIVTRRGGSFRFPALIQNHRYLRSTNIKRILR
jgi:hypothetical protein